MLSKVLDLILPWRLWRAEEVRILRAKLNFAEHERDLYSRRMDQYLKLLNEAQDE
jgi:hypothetical protein